MTQTAVGLFKNARLAEETVRELEAAGMGKTDIRVLAEPRYMPVTGVLSTPGADFCADLHQDLKTMGATEPEAEIYIRGVRNGGVLVFANGSAQQVQTSVEIMNRHTASNVDELSGPEPIRLGVSRDREDKLASGTIQLGRVRGTGEGARIFVW